jgi:hypothetical protein
MVFTVGHPSGSIKEVTTLCDSVIVPVTGREIDKLVKKNDYYRKAVIPGGMYRGTDSDTQTFGVCETFVTSAKVPEDVIYNVVKAVFENFEDFKKLHPAFAVLTKENTLEGLSAPLHPGALKYYKSVVWSEVPKAIYPNFPWPPLKASARVDIPSRVLRKKGGDKAVLAHVDSRITAALERCGYGERSYYAVPGGFALVTRLEQFTFPDGTSKEPPDRWAIEVNRPTKFSLTAILRALFTADPGFYRIIVFLVTPHSYIRTDISVNRKEAMHWLDSGMNKLPNSIAEQIYTKAHTCSALIYEFEQPGWRQEAKLALPGRLSGVGHIKGSKIQRMLEVF